MIRNRANSLKPICRIDATAFASVMVVLVVMTMLSRMEDLNPHHGIGADLPKVLHPIEMWNATRDNALIITILRDGACFFGRDRVSVEDLPTKIREQLSNGAERKAYLRADARLPYGVVKAVLEMISSAGVERIGVLTDQRRTSYLSM